MAALLIGAFQLARAKGTGTHRAMGNLWVLLMVAIAVSSFWVHEINQWNGFSLIHLLSILTLVSVPIAILAARSGNIRRHRITMLSLYWGALVLAGFFTLMPGRIMHRLLFG